jgi:hypothetical protein
MWEKGFRCEIKRNSKMEEIIYEESIVVGKYELTNGGFTSSKHYTCSLEVPN